MPAIVSAREAIRVSEFKPDGLCDQNPPPVVSAGLHLLRQLNSPFFAHKGLRLGVSEAQLGSFCAVRVGDLARLRSSRPGPRFMGRARFTRSRVKLNWLHLAWPYSQQQRFGLGQDPGRLLHLLRDRR
jgi:hypothetical protein